MEQKVGVLLINLGTPDGTSVPQVRRYLKEFLSDRRVIDRGGLFWRLLLNRVIVPRRAKEFSKSYRLIWNVERDESPLKTITRAQAEKLAVEFASDPGIVIDWAMRYGTPSIRNGIGRLSEAGCTQLLIFPLYPQYSAATTASAMDKVFDCLKTMQWQPSLLSLPPYFAAPAYIDAVAESVTTHASNLGWPPEVTILSFHGLPRSFIEKGDPYQAQCETTATLLRAALNADHQTLPIAYQSSSGRPGWLGPDLADAIAGKARAGVRNLSVVAPGFAADCIETLEEIEIRAAEVFLRNGGENFSFVPCLNDGAAAIEMMSKCIRFGLNR